MQNILLEKKIILIVFTFLNFLQITVGKSTFTAASNVISRQKRQSSNGAGCLLPPHPQNGVYSLNNGDTYTKNAYVQVFTFIDLECNEGFQPSQASYFVCARTSWAPEVSDDICIRSCPSLPSTDTYDTHCYHSGVNVSCENPLNGTSARAICKPLHTYGGKRVDSLCTNGFWDSYPAPCERDTCPSLPSTDTYEISCYHRGVEVSCEKPLDKTEARTICKPSYISRGNRTNHLCINGLWDSHPTSCEPEECVCKRFSACRSAILEVRRNGRPKICSFDGVYPIVCCHDGPQQYESNDPVENTSKGYSEYIPFDPGNISLKKCKEYHASVTKINKIAPEHGPKIQQYPHSAIIGYKEEEEENRKENEEKISWLCSGTLISEEFVLLSAYCVARRKRRPYYVRLGDLDFYSSYDDEDPQQFTIKKTVVHPNYKRPSNYNNIALIQLSRPAKLNSYVRPACLAVTKDLNGTLPEALQWDIASPEKLSATLKVDYYNYISNEECRKMYRADRAIADEQQICAGSSNYPYSVAIYGHLQITNFLYEFNNFPEVVGITSFSKIIGGVAGIYTRVYPYVPWIEKNVWPEN